MVKRRTLPALEEEHRNPSFFTFFLPGVTDERLAIPNAFLRHMEGEKSGTVSLVGPSRNIWPVHLTKNRDGLFLQSGWREFVKDHSLTAGECLIFSHDSRMLFTVKIFDTSSCEKEGAFGAKPCLSSTGLCMEKRITRSSTVKALITSSHRASSTSLEHSKRNEPETRQLYAPRIDHLRKNRSQEKFRNKKARTLIEEETGSAVEAAKSMESNNPTATILMGRTQVTATYILYFPLSFSRAWLPKSAVTMTLNDPSGKSWKTRYIYMKDRGGGALSAGWKTFASANKLQERDACVFELIRSCNMRVHIFRATD